MYFIEKKARKNSKKYTKTNALSNESDVLEYMEVNDLSYIKETPYIFTHIELSDGSIITQNYQGLICSPTKLLEVLKGKQSK